MKSSIVVERQELWNICLKSDRRFAIKSFLEVSGSAYVAKTFADIRAMNVKPKVIYRMKLPREVKRVVTNEAESRADPTAEDRALRYPDFQNVDDYYIVDGEFQTPRFKTLSDGPRTTHRPDPEPPLPPSVALVEPLSRKIDRGREAFDDLPERWRISTDFEKHPQYIDSHRCLIGPGVFSRRLC